MHAVAIERGLPFLDIFGPTARLFDREEPALTTNSVHLNNQGERLVAALLIQALGLGDPTQVELVRGDDGSVRASKLPTGLQPAIRFRHRGSGSQLAVLEASREIANGSVAEWQVGVALESPVLSEAAETLRNAVVQKNRLFFDRYRAVNGYYIYGERRRPFGVESFPQRWPASTKRSPSSTGNCTGWLEFLIHCPGNWSSRGRSDWLRQRAARALEQAPACARAGGLVAGDRGRPSARSRGDRAQPGGHTRSGNRRPPKGARTPPPRRGLHHRAVR